MCRITSSPSKLTCHTCNETLTRKPHMSDAYWLGVKGEFMERHSSIRSHGENQARIRAKVEQLRKQLEFLESEL